ncbi:MAG: putative membrane protein [Akkermansiaceae bacterium]
MSGAVWLPLIGAALHPLLGWCIQQGARRGVKLTVTVAVANLVTGLIFLCYLDPEGGWRLTGRDWWAVGNGVLFFLGQSFSIQSVKSGDLAVHSSALGMKVVIVGFCSMLVGLEPSSWNLITGVFLATFAVFLVSGGSAEGWRTHRVTVGFTLLACLFFGFNDFLTGWQSREIGIARWLMLMMGTSSVISVGLLLRRTDQVKALITSPRISVFILGAGLLLGLQALIVNLAFSRYGQPTLSNVVYSSRGLMAVLFLFLIGRKSDPRFVRKQTFGAILMVLTLAIVLGA